MQLPNQLQINNNGLTDCYAERKNRTMTVPGSQVFLSPHAQKSMFVSMPPSFSLTQGNKDDAQTSILVIAAKDLDEYDAILTSLRNRGDAFKNKFDEQITLNLDRDVGDEEFMFFLPPDKTHTMISFNSGSHGQDASSTSHEYSGRPSRKSAR